MVKSMILGFMQSEIVGQSEDLKKKKINKFIFGRKSEGYLCVCLSLCVIECLYVCICAVARVIITHPSQYTFLSYKFEIISKCRHENKHLSQFDPNTQSKHKQNSLPFLIF